MERLTAALNEYEKLAMDEWARKHLPGDDVDVETEGQMTFEQRRRYLYHPDLPKLVRLLVNTGLRKNEALSLEWRDINLDDTPTITVRGEAAKSSRRRVIPINKKLAADLMPSMGLAREEAVDLHRERVKEQGHKRVFSLQNPKKAWQKLRTMADLEHITMHQLRHNFASQLVLRGVALSVVKKLMGHTSIETTQLYLSVRKEDAVEAVNLL